jgi:hypothetical protein
VLPLLRGTDPDPHWAPDAPGPRGPLVVAVALAPAHMRYRSPHPHQGHRRPARSIGRTALGRPAGRHTAPFPQPASPVKLDRSGHRDIAASARSDPRRSQSTSRLVVGENPASRGGHLIVVIGLSTIQQVGAPCRRMLSCRTIHSPMRSRSPVGRCHHRLRLRTSRRFRGRRNR